MTFACRMLWTCLVLLMAAPLTRAETKLPAVFSDNMVLQQNQPLPVWGTDSPGTEVSVTIGDAKVAGKADDAGKWSVKLPAMKASKEARELKVAGTSTLTLKNVLVGEVWLCSGQSNMEWTVSQSKNPKEEIAAADHPLIRHIKIPHVPADKPQAEIKAGGWQVCTPQTAANFTAVGYYFARELQKELDVPVGLIGSNWGGTRIEPWISPEGFKAVPALKSIADALDTYPKKNAKGQVEHQSALALYNGMIHPLVPYAIQGTIWYQGESNVGEGMLYTEKMKALIAGWRKVWNRDDMPFGFVQLAPFKYNGPSTNLPGIWEAQTATLAVPHTGMAGTTDTLGPNEITDIHPKNKQDVGKRLALWALAKTYGKSDLVYSGPIYKSMKVDGSKVRITFDHAAGGLASRDSKPLNSFTIAGADQKFVEATAEIDGESVVVSAASVDKPTAVRFGWHQEAQPNLANKAGLPASPFRTDK